ncbi:VOC family protein [Shimia sagamensis]|uniref:Glyoxalase/Bleomycin resistance protein/Dioxygenase superfamily protein n=1 Tax=Shimia sagamensis TaxID=1566352 RepID=A0ABY1NC25_9RHOB|nr:VOC family protein [Shimia sagamensis]SMP04127.1 Glyoxalase/Bleomycin resistance protein/Dioxygenase superfamily protein [Shimia sagamensis]
MSDVQAQISWVYTEKLDTAAGFYRDVLRLPVVRDAGSALIFETAPGARLGLCEAFDGRVVEPKGGMITLLVANRAAVDDWYQRVTAAGATLRGAPEVLETFGIYSFFCEDPNSYVVEVQCFLDEAQQ